MNNKSIIQVLGSLEELNISQNVEDCSKIRTFCINSTNYGLLLYSTNEKRISFFNLHLSKLICEGSYNRKSLTDNYRKDLYELTLLKVFHLSLNVINVICTTENIWTIGYKAVFNLKPYVKSAYEKFLLKEECMDSDDVEEYNPEKLVINIDVPESNNSFDQGDIFIGCSFIDNGFVLCHKNSMLGRWQLELVQLRKRNSLSSNWTSEQFLNFPVSFDDNTNICSTGEVCVPVIRFIHLNSPERVICENVLGIRCLPSSIVCLVGHPDGKLLWSSWDKNQLHSSEDLQTLLDTKQPIVGMDFFHELKDGGCLLIVGSLGQVTVISQSLRIQTWHLKSSVVDCIIVKNCLVYFSKYGTLGMAELSPLMAWKEVNEDSCGASSCTELSSIQQMISVGKDQGLILMLSNCGNLYLTSCGKEECSILSSSLPYLMNECVTQCTSMQELLRTKSLQSRLFATISTFASLKCSAHLLSNRILFSISEVSVQPRKYLLLIDCRCLEKFRLDPELCHLSASVCTTTGCILLTKTVAYQPGDPRICLEMCESILLEEALCPSPFPLLVEVGLVLRLPNSFMTSMDCSALLPLQLCLSTLVIHEALHLSSARSRKPLLCGARQLAEGRPVANVLLPRSHSPACLLPEKFDLCLSVSTVQQMMTVLEDTTDVDPCAFISQLLFGTQEGPALIFVKKESVVVSGCAEPDALIALRGAVLHTLLSNEVTCDPSTHVMIPASLYKKAEDICGRLLSVFGRDLESEEVTQTLLTLYGELRREISDKMPIL